MIAILPQPPSNQQNPRRRTERIGPGKERRTFMDGESSLAHDLIGPSKKPQGRTARELLGDELYRLVAQEPQEVARIYKRRKPARQGFAEIPNIKVTYHVNPSFANEHFRGDRDYLARQSLVSV